MQQTANPVGSELNPWRLAVLAGMASYLDAAAFIATASALVLYKHTLGITAGDIGVLTAILTVTFMSGALVGGRLGDLYGRRTIYTWSLLFYLAGVVTIAVAPSQAVLTVGIVVMGFAIGGDLPVSLALINEEAPPGMAGRMVSFASVLTAAGIVVSSVLTVAVGEMGGTGARILFIHLALVSATVLVLRSRTPESTAWKSAHESAEQAEHADQVDAPVESADAAPALLHLRGLLEPDLRTTVIMLGGYYALWSLSAATLAAFGPFLWVEVADQPLHTQALLGSVALPFCGLGLWVWLRVVDTNRRVRWFRIGCALSCLAWVFPLVLGANAFSLVMATMLVQVSASFSGEIIYRVWSQEHVPVLLRSTAQGVMMAFGRICIAAAAIGTPALAVAAPRVLFALLTSACVTASLLGLAWTRRIGRERTSTPFPPTTDATAVAAVA